jgi:hypothetical protein
MFEHGREKKIKAMADRTKRLIFLGGAVAQASASRQGFPSFRSKSEVRKRLFYHTVIGEFERTKAASLMRTDGRVGLERVGSPNYAKLGTVGILRDDP